MGVALLQVILFYIINSLIFLGSSKLLEQSVVFADLFCDTRLFYSLVLHITIALDNFKQTKETNSGALFASCQFQWKMYTNTWLTAMAGPFLRSWDFWLVEQQQQPGRNNSYLCLPYRLSLGWAKADQYEEGEKASERKIKQDKARERKRKGKKE